MIEEIDKSLDEIWSVTQVPEYAWYATESAYRQYAKQYNVSHPNRKLGWRRLNDRQKMQAVLNYVLGG